MKMKKITEICSDNVDSHAKSAVTSLQLVDFDSLVFQLC